MKKYFLLILFTVVIWEAGIYFFASQLSDLNTLKYQLAARYSARTSFVIIVSLLSWLGLAGLEQIYVDQKWRKIFIALIFAFAVNHLIHFIFIVLNFHANKMNLFEVKNTLGAMGYVLLSLAPFYLWYRTKLTKVLYIQIHLFFLLISTIFFLTYLGRLTKTLPERSPTQFYGACLFILSALIVLNLYRLSKEGKFRRSAINR